MTEMEYIKQLEERVERLESIIMKITIAEGNDISFNGCPLADIYVPEGCNLSFNNCPIGSVMPGDVEDAEDKIVELESYLEDAEDKIVELESRLEDIVEHIDDIDKK